MRRTLFTIAAFAALCACGDDEGAARRAVELPRASLDPPAYAEPAEWERTGKEVMPLDNIVAELEPIWREVGSCEQAGYARETGGKTYSYHFFHVYNRGAQKAVDLACEMEAHGYYVSHVAQVKKDIWSDYDKRVEPRLFTFVRIRSADGAADFATYLVHNYHLSGGVNLDGCDHDEQRCHFSYYPSHVINMRNGLYTRFKIERRNRNDYYEDSGIVALLLGKEMPEVEAFVSGASDGIPRALALRALVREVQRQYPEGTKEALDLFGHVRPMSSGIVIEDVGANFGLAGTDASYLVKLTDAPTCEETENEKVRRCVLKVATSVVAYNRASGSRQTKLAQIANVAAAGTQTGEIEALFIQDEDGWRMVVTDEIARFLSGVDRRNDWVVRTSDGRTLSGMDAIDCINDPDDC